MSKKNIKGILITILSIFILITGGLGFLRYYSSTRNNIVYSQGLNRKDLDLVISDYIKNNYFNWTNEESKKKYEAHKIYGIDKVIGYEYVYLYTMFEAFYENSDKPMTGGANPLVIIVKKDGDGVYSVVNYKEPLDGEENLTSLRILFPRRYLTKMNSNDASKELQDKINSQRGNLKAE